MGGVTVRLSFHGYSQKVTVKWNIEWNITPTHTTRLQDFKIFPPSTGKYLSGRENRWSHSSQTHSMSSYNWWIGRRWYLSKQAGSKWTGEIKEMSAHFYWDVQVVGGLRGEKERWGKIQTAVGNSDKPDETTCWKKLYFPWPALSKKCY